MEWETGEGGVGGEREEEGGAALLFLAAYLLLTAGLGFDLLFEAEAHLLLLLSSLPLFPWKQQHTCSTPVGDLLLSGDQPGHHHLTGCHDDARPGGEGGSPEGGGAGPSRWAGPSLCLWTCGQITDWLLAGWSQPALVTC